MKPIARLTVGASQNDAVSLDLRISQPRFFYIRMVWFHGYIRLGGLTPALHLRATSVRVHNSKASFKNTAPDRCKRWLDGSLSKEPPRPNAEPGTHQHKQVSMVEVSSGDGLVCVRYRDGREENARGSQIRFHERSLWVMCVAAD